MLPDTTHVQFGAWSLEPASSDNTIASHARQTIDRRPLCNRRSKRVHSRYEKTFAKLAWGEYSVASGAMSSAGLSIGIWKVVKAECVCFQEGSTCVIIMRDDAASPGSKGRLTREQHLSNMRCATGSIKLVSDG